MDDLVINTAVRLKSDLSSFASEIVIISEVSATGFKCLSHAGVTFTWTSVDWEKTFKGE